MTVEDALDTYSYMTAGLVLEITFLDVFSLANANAFVGTSVATLPQYSLLGSLMAAPSLSTNREGVSLFCKINAYHD